MGHVHKGGTEKTRRFWGWRGGKGKTCVVAGEDTSTCQKKKKKSLSFFFFRSFLLTTLSVRIISAVLCGGGCCCCCSPFTLALFFGTAFVAPCSFRHRRASPNPRGPWSIAGAPFLAPAHQSPCMRLASSSGPFPLFSSSTRRRPWRAAPGRSCRRGCGSARRPAAASTQT